MSDLSSRGPLRASATLLLVLLSLAWGLSWAAIRIALDEVTPWTLRMLAYANGALFLFALVRLQDRQVKLPRGPAALHVGVSALLNVMGFGLLTTFAQFNALTSRVVIVAYSMPVWASLMAWLALGERPTAISLIGLILCISGLTVLIAPLAASGVPLGLVLALAAALSWAAGTVYLKWARIQGDPVVITAWQLLVSFAAVASCVAVFEGMPHLWPLRAATLLALAFHGVIATGVAYVIWFDIVGRLPVATASLGSLCVPVVGVLGSIAMLGDRPTFADAIGFALIFAAAACVLLPPALGSVSFRSPGNKT